MKLGLDNNLLNIISLPFQTGKTPSNAPISAPIKAPLQSSGELCKSATSRAVSDTMTALIELNSKNGKFNSAAAIQEARKRTENLAELYNYVYQNPVLAPLSQDYKQFEELMSYVYSQNIKTDFSLKDRLPSLKKLSDLGAKPENRELFKMIGDDLFLSSFIYNTDHLSSIAPEALENVNYLLNSKDLQPFALGLDKDQLVQLLNEKENNKIISKNISLLEKAIKRPEFAFLKDTAYIDPEIIRFDGDFKSLLNFIKDKNSSLQQGEKLSFYLDYVTGESQIIIKNQASPNMTHTSTYYYGKDLKLDSTSTSTEGLNKNGQKTLNTFVKDLKTNTTHKTREIFNEDKKRWEMNSHISEQKDAAGKLVNREIIKQSNVPGAYNIKTQDAQGHIHTKSSATRNKEGTKIIKNLVSTDGTVSKIRYNLTPDGKKEAFGYEISDRDGKILAQKTDYKTHLSDSQQIQDINGKKYKITYFKDEIIIFDETAGKSSKMNLRELSGDAKNVFREVMKKLPAPELISMSENLSELTSTELNKSASFSAQQKIASNADPFTLEHEYGHCKNKIKNTSELPNLLTFGKDSINYEIASDNELQKIFAQEKKLFDAKFPKPIRKMANYYMSNMPLKGEKLGRISEAISDINALKNLPLIPEWVVARAHLLQENCPKTIAYILKHVI